MDAHARRFIPVVGYAIAWRYLNALSDSRPDCSGLRFLCEGGALDRRGESRDRDAMRAWRRYVDGRPALSLVEVYGLLLQMLDHFLAHGGDAAMQAIRLQLSRTADGLPAEPGLRGWWLRAVRDVERDVESGRPFRGTNPARLGGLSPHGAPLSERLTRDEEMAMYRRMGEAIP